MKPIKQDDNAPRTPGKPPVRPGATRFDIAGAKPEVVGSAVAGATRRGVAPAANHPTHATGSRIAGNRPKGFNRG